nr:uncharacterized protein LOC115269932 [Aedes albopictus]
MRALLASLSKKLQLPDQILKILTDSGIELEQLTNINKDGLAQIIDPQEWNVDEVFARLTRWRQEQGFQLLGFEAVELSSESVPPPSPPLSPAPSSIIIEDYLSDEGTETDPKVIPATGPKVTDDNYR